MLSCYSHVRGGANDLIGDISYEEARWSNLQVRMNSWRQIDSERGCPKIRTLAEGKGVHECVGPWRLVLCHV